MTALTTTPKARTKKNAGVVRRRATLRMFTYLGLGVVGILWILPLIWMVLGSLKTQAEILAKPPTWWPREFTLENFVKWFQELNFGQFFTNSVVVAILTVLGNIVFCSMLGYALAKMEFRGKKILFGAVMVTLMVPSVALFVPMFVIVSKIGLVNTYGALILPFLTQPIGVFLMRQFIMGIPDEIIEAARIDGAGEFRIFSRVVMPLCGAPVATLSIITFLFSWNNFLWPLVAAQSQDMYTLPVALSLYSTGQNSTDYGVLLAGSVLVIAPIVILFLLLQRYFIQGVATTGLK